MFKKTKSMLFALIICTLSTGILAGIEDVNPSLNKVQWLPSPEHEPITIVKDGKAAAIIVIADSMSDRKAFRLSVRPAANLLQRYIRQVTGITLPILSERNAARKKNVNMIILGNCKMAIKAGVVTDKLPDEGFVVKTFPHGVVIAGVDDKAYSKGTLWGTFDFIERFLGFRFYYPGIGTYVPKSRSKLVLAPMAYTDHPRLSFRFDWTMNRGFNKNKWPWDTKKYGSYFPEIPEMWARYRMQHEPTRVPRAMHSGKDWPKKYGKTRPEIFVKDKYGIRHIGENNVAFESWVDISNPRTLETFMEEVRQGLNIYDNAVRFGLMDVSFELKNNPLYNSPDVAGHEGTMSDILADFYRRLSLAVKKEFPEKIVPGLCYLNYSMPPRRIKEMPDNFQAMICLRGSPAAGKDPALMKILKAQMSGWNKVVKRKPLIWDYLPGSLGYPAFYLNDIKKYFAEIMSQSNGAFHDSWRSWKTEHFMKYVLSRMEWNPDFDIEAAQKEYCRLMYGAAFEPIEKLYFLLRERWDSVPKYTIRVEEAYTKMYPPEVIVQIKSLLDKAKNCVKEGSVERLRVDFFASGFDKFFINAKACQSRTKVQMKVGQRMEEIIIDGIPTEQGWRHSDKVTMRNVINGLSSKYPTECQAAYDSEALYLLFVMKDNHPDKLLANAKTRNGAVYRDDSVEVLIMPGKKSPHYYQLIVNPAATIYATKCTKDSAGRKKEPWAAKNMTHMVKIRKDGWILELKIPWKALGVSQPKVGDEWPVNLVRNKRTEPRESQSVSMTLGNNHIVDRWGNLKFDVRGF